MALLSGASCSSHDHRAAGRHTENDVRVARESSRRATRRQRRAERLNIDHVNWMLDSGLARSGDVFALLAEAAYDAAEIDNLLAGTAQQS